MSRKLNRRFTRSIDRQAPFRATRARGFLRDILKIIVDKGKSGRVIQGLIAEPELAESIERLGNDGQLDDYLPVPWSQIAGIDIKYRWQLHQSPCHHFTLEVNGQAHDEFQFPYVEPTASN